jgi:hypothetical protein
MSQISKSLNDEEKRKIINAAIKLVNENAGNFLENDREGITKSSLRNLLSAADGLPEEFIVFSHYLAGKNDRNENLKNFIEKTNKIINDLAKQLKRDNQKGLIIKEFMTAIVMASRYCAAFNKKIEM